jgi:hypothetical protein
LTYYPDGGIPADLVAYGKEEGLHMVYALEGDPKEYRLPYPVPLNTVTNLQIWSWIGGVIPGAAALAWLWKKAVGEEQEARIEKKEEEKAEERAHE